MILRHGDCLDRLKELPDNSVDSIVTDPPYGLGFMGKKWDTFDNSQFGKGGEEGKNDLKVKKNFKILPRYNIDGLYTFTKDWATECLRVIKPGGMLLSFAGSRTYHKICMGIEDAGFEIRDQIMWIYGSGFPKSHNIGKAVDKLQGNEREKTAQGISGKEETHSVMNMAYTENGKSNMGGEYDITKGTSQWEGWGTALKPAHEPIVVARKPLSEKTVALNVLKYGTGGINIDGCRVGTEITKTCIKDLSQAHGNQFGKAGIKYPTLGFKENPQGRFPANIIFDEEAGKILDEQTGELKTGELKSNHNRQKNSLYGGSSLFESKTINTSISKASKGGASRFFYCAKASKSDRNEGCEELEDKRGGSMDANVSDKMQLGGASLKGEHKEIQPTKNNHPTVKPTKLMQYLVRLVTPKGAICLDPFMGSGSTGKACVLEGMDFIGFELDESYFEIAKKRINAVKVNTLDNYSQNNGEEKDV